MDGLSGKIPLKMDDFVTWLVVWAMAAMAE